MKRSETAASDSNLTKVCLRAAQLLHNPQQFKRKTGWMVGNLSEILAGRMKSNCLVSPKFRA